MLGQTQHSSHALRGCSQARGISLCPLPVLIRGVQGQDLLREAVGSLVLGCGGSPAPGWHPTKVLAEMMDVGIRHFQRRCGGWSPRAPDLRGFLCMLAWAGEATRQELRLLGGSCAFPSSPTAQAKCQTTAPLRCPAAALHKEGLRGTRGSRLGWETSAGERGEGQSGCPGWGTGPAAKSHPRTAPKHVQRKEGRRGSGLEMPSHEGVAIPMGNWGGAR